MQPTPPPPKPRRPSGGKLFVPKQPQPVAVLHTERPKVPVRKRSVLPVVGLLMLLTGAWMLFSSSSDFWDDFGAPDMALPTIVVDAGHGGHDTGARNNGLREKDLTLDTAKRLERMLRKLGFPVVMTRKDDRFIELFERASIANRLPRALFVSVHFNDNTTASGDGVETFYAGRKAAFSDDGWSLTGMFKSKPEAPPEDHGAAFAQTVQANIVSKLRVTDRGAKPRQFAVVRLTRCPAVLVEGGFLNNPAEARRLCEPAYREQLAAAIAGGVQDYHRMRVEQAQAAKVAQR